MRRSELAQLRVLVVGAKGYAVSMLRTVLNAAGVSRVDSIPDARRALGVLCTETVDAVFIEDRLELDGRPFALAARRTQALRNPLVPIFMVYSGVRRRDVEWSRDLGVHGVITRPISPRTIAEKLHSAVAAPRPFIAAADFFGPDRRVQARAALFAGQDRRARTPRKAKLQILDI